MKRLTMKRKAELLEKYPNGNAIGRVIIEDYLNGERKKRGFNYDKKTVLSEEEIAFLIGTISTDEDILAYNKHVKFRDAIYTLMNMVSCLTNLFYCGHFHILQIIQPAMIGLEGYVVNPDSIKNNSEISRKYKKILKNIVTNSKDELLSAWEDMTTGLRGLCFYDAVLKTIGDIYSFNFDVIRPETEKCTERFIDLTNDLNTFRDVISDYQNASKGQKGAISIPNSFPALLKEMGSTDYKELQVNEETFDILKSMLKKANINIPTIHAIMNTITDTPLHWGQCSYME